MKPHEWESLIQLHAEWLQARGYATTTVKARARQLQHFHRWCLEAASGELEDYSLLTLEEFRLHLHRRRKANGDPLGWGSKVQMLLAIRGFFRWLTLMKHIPSNPAADVELPRQPTRLPRAVLTVVEVERVLAHRDLENDAGLRGRAIMETLYSTGIRRAECAHLSLGDLELGRGVLLVRSGKGARDRYVPIGERASRWVERYLREVRPIHTPSPDDRRLFRPSRRNPLSPKRIGDLTHRHVVLTALGKTGSCHLFRHRMATHLLERGADIRYIQEILGHTQLSTTAIYARVSTQHLREVHRRCHPAG